MNNDNIENLDLEETGKKAKREIAGNQENITYVNDCIRFITMSDGIRKLEKLNKYKDGTEAFVFKGWYGKYKTDEIHMFNDIIALLKESKLKEKEVSDIKYYIECVIKAGVMVESYLKNKNKK